MSWQHTGESSQLLLPLRPPLLPLLLCLLLLLRLPLLLVAAEFVAGEGSAVSQCCGATSSRVGGLCPCSNTWPAVCWGEGKRGVPSVEQQQHTAAAAANNGIDSCNLCISQQQAWQ
jgi:hypothetical protein